MIGASAERSWAKDSHIPAIAQVEGVMLGAVATRDAVSARRAAAAFEADKWFDDPFALIADPSIDVVSVCVKVPDHRDLVLAALAASKHVYCEWPLGRTVAEAEEMAAAAIKSGVHHAIGLQARLAPAARRARDIVNDGALGRLLQARVTSTTAGYAPTLPSAYAYLNRRESGANLATILGGHTLDLAELLLGDAVDLRSVNATQWPMVVLSDTGQRIERHVPDLVLVASRHASGCLLMAEVAGNRPADTRFTFEIVGEDATVTLTGGHPHSFQAGALSVETSWGEQPVPAPLASGGLAGAAANVAEVYAALAHDIRTDSRTVPDFVHAARLTRLVQSMI